MAVMDSFRAIIDAWPSRSVLASDIGTTAQAVSNMRARNSIPSRYWSTLIAAAVERAIPGVTADSLTRLSALEAA